MMEQLQIAEIAHRLDSAAMEATPVRQVSLGTPLTLTDAYAIQKASIQRRIDRGEQLIGLKLGFTSKAKMEQMGVHDMIWGRLTDSMLIKEDDLLHLDRYVHPRAEPELCFRFSEQVSSPISLEEAYDVVDAVAPAVEIIDSRYEHFKFSLEDVVADNCSSSGLAVGAWQSPQSDLGDLHMQLIINSELMHQGSSSAILGNPWESVVAITRLASQDGLVIPPGAILMAGAATAAEYLHPDQTIEVRVEGLGSVSFRTQ